MPLSMLARESDGTTVEALSRTSGRGAGRRNSSLAARYNAPPSSSTMPTLLSRIRASLFVTATFVGIWGGCALVGGVVGSVLRGGPTILLDPSALESIGRFVMRLAFYGAANGLLFSVVFALRERGRLFSRLSPVRAASSGAIAAGLLLAASAVAPWLGPRLSTPRELVLNLGVVSILGAVSGFLVVAIAASQRQGNRARAADTLHT